MRTIDDTFHLPFIVRREASTVKRQTLENTPSHVFCLTPHSKRKK